MKSLGQRRRFTKWTQRRFRIAPLLGTRKWASASYLIKLIDPKELPPIATRGTVAREAVKYERFRTLAKRDRTA